MKIKTLLTTLILLACFHVKGQFVIDLTTGSPDVTGSPDDDWTVLPPGSGSFVPAFISTNQVLHTAVPQTSYATNTCGKWISPYIDPVDHHILKTKPDGSAVDAGDFIYRMNFTLEDSCEILSAVLNLHRIGADNSVSEVSINGNVYPFPTVEFWPLETRIIPILPSDLLMGSNVIDFTVHNIGSFNAFMVCGNLTLERDNCGDCGAIADFDITVPIDKKSCNKINFVNTSTWTPPGPFSPMINYHWDFGDGNTSTAFSPTHSYQYNGTYNVTLTMSAVGIDGECCTETITQTVVIDCPCDVNPQISYDQHKCEFYFFGHSVPYGTTHPIAWHWDFGDGTTASGPSVSHIYGDSGTYIVSLTVVGYNGKECCSETVTYELAVECDGLCDIDPAFSYTTDDENDEIDFLNESFVSGVTGPVTYYWDFGDGNTSNLENPSHAYVDEGDYLVTLTVTSFTEEGCCSETITLNVHVDYDAIPVLGGDGDLIKEDFLQISPNPADDYITVTFTKEVVGKVDYQIVNLEGVLLIGGTFYESGSEINVSRLGSGIYTIVFINWQTFQQINFIKN